MNQHLDRLASEPFRLFFPWGVLTGGAGAALWPLYLCGVLPYHPGQAHARLMIAGFVGAFAMGFLGTAGPRMLAAPPFGKLETFSLLSLHVAAVTAQVAGSLQIGDAFFAATWVGLIALATWRLSCHRRDLPPPGFVLTAAGVLAATIGAIWLAARWDSAGGVAYTLPRILLYKAFLVLAALGVGGFFFPRLMGRTSRHDLPSTPRPTAEWARIAIQALACAAALSAAFVAEAFGHIRAGCAVRAVVIIIWLAVDIPGFWTRRVSNTMAWALRASLASFVAAPAIRAVHPDHPVAIEHILFVTGFGLLAFVVSLRVVFGHADALDKISGRCRPIQALVWLIVLTMATRVSADIWPKVQRSHYIYAAGTWILASVLYLVIVSRASTGRDDGRQPPSPEG